MMSGVPDGDFGNGVTGKMPVPLCRWRLWHWGHRQDACATLRAGAKLRLGQGRDGLAAAV